MADVSGERINWLSGFGAPLGSAVRAPEAPWGVGRWVGGC